MIGNSYSNSKSNSHSSGNSYGYGNTYRYRDSVDAGLHDAERHQFSRTALLPIRGVASGLRIRRCRTLTSSFQNCGTPLPFFKAIRASRPYLR